VLLNVDLGELPDEPEELYAYAHLANVACGGHAGDEASMRRAVGLCLTRGVRLGAHPSYPDRASFGRATMRMAAAELAESVAAQCASLHAVARAMGAEVRFVKAHGALYHAARADAAVAEALLAGIDRALGASVTVAGPAAGALRDACRQAGVAYAREVFADRATRPDGTLVPRIEPGALILDPVEAAARAQHALRRGDAETICVHGDTPGAVAVARAVREALDAADRA
jgi:5-oxoprolinase (ATP-hydrolysing) subunit A